MDFNDIEMDATPSLHAQCLKALNDTFKQEFEAISEYVAETILRYSGIPVKFHDELIGGAVVTTNCIAEPVAEATHGSVVLNISMVKGSGVYTWKLRCQNNGTGCRYVGVIDGKDLVVSNLNSNLQSGCRGRRIAWDGGCSTVYEDMNGYVPTRIGGRCREEYELTIIADMNRCIVTFLFPDGTSHNAKIPRSKTSHVFYPVIGFGRPKRKLEKWKLISFSHRE